MVSILTPNEVPFLHKCLTQINGVPVTPPFLQCVRPRKLKIFLYINPYGYSLQTKFHVPRSHTFREKCDDNLKLALHFSPILCDRGT